jgi:hypothetical protein
VAREATPEEQQVFSGFGVAFALVLARIGIRVPATVGFSKQDPLMPDSTVGYDPDDVASFRIQVVDKNVLDRWY